MTQRNTEQTIEWLRGQVESKSTAWKGYCLKLCREARGLPAVYPSALAAAQATPREDRVFNKRDLRRGMVAYFDDPNDGNPYGHIVTIAGRKRGTDEIVCFSNDVKGPGLVSRTNIVFFPRYWGDSFQFGATSLNGFDLLLPDRTAREPHAGPNFDKAIEALGDAIAYHEKRGHDAMVRALREDLAEVRETKKRFS